MLGFYCVGSDSQRYNISAFYLLCVQVRGFVTVAEPYSGCSEITNAEYVQGHIALLQRGQCMFAEKARHIQKAGAIGGIVIGECEKQKTQDRR